MNKQMKMLLFAVVILLGLFVFVPLLTKTDAQMSPVKNENEDASTNGLSPEELAEIGGTPGTSDGGRTLTLSRALEAASREVYFAQTGGQVDVVNYQEGARVKKGDLILHLLLTDVQFAVEKATQAKAEAQRALDLANHSRTYTMKRAEQTKINAAREVTSAEDTLERTKLELKLGLENARESERVAKIGVKQARVRLARALLSYNQHRRLAGLQEVKAGADGESSVAPRPDADSFDDEIVSMDAYIASELMLLESETALESAKAAASQASLNLKRQVETHDMTKSAAERALESAKDAKTQADIAYDDQDGSTKLAVSRAQGGLDSATTALNQIKSTEEKHKVYAEQDGILAELTVQKGDTVSYGTKLCTVVDPSTLHARVYAPAKFLPLFERVERRTGKRPTVTATTDAFDLLPDAKGLKYSAEIISYSKETMNASSQGILIKLKFNKFPISESAEGNEEKTELALDQGMLVNMTFDLSAAFDK